ncbi:Hypothetical protein BALAC2494_01723 [Bifidobacterium animalis subsp. lactis CNCM I-2494]|uniref:Uncharacterized protein n=1 Tax=Bifidobacterium animalis subsp. lactis CNCM I-2494 TaxID=1042403 RepID=A0A806FZR2_BIFAN|nr:Hypothetical protein BALAC2494_01723 [Bifidobacterium animalis subsp. lactis CNCM I-2494]
MAAQRHEPDPQQAGDGERNRGDRGGRRTFLDVDVVAARDDDAGECRRQGHSHDEHGELVHIAAHAQQQADAEECRRGENQAVERVPDRLPAQRELHSGEREAGGQHGDTGVRFGNQVEGGSETGRHAHADEHEHDGEQRSPAHRLLECVDERFEVLVLLLAHVRRLGDHHLCRLVGLRILVRIDGDIVLRIGDADLALRVRDGGLRQALAILALAEVDQIHADRNRDGVDDDRDDRDDEVRAHGVAVDRVEHGEAEEADGRRAGDQRAYGRFLDRMVEHQSAQVVAQHEHHDDADEAENCEHRILCEHLTGRLDDRDEQCGREGDVQHELVEALTLIVVEVAEFSTDIAQRHDDDDGDDVVYQYLCHLSSLVFWWSGREHRCRGADDLSSYHAAALRGTGANHIWAPLR